MDKNKPLWGIDVASYQSGINMRRAKNEGYDFCVVKASEGPSTDGWVYVNPRFKEQFDGAREAGMVPGVYHFLLEGPTKTQADLFAKHIGDPSGKLVMIDFEAYNPPYGHYTPSNATLKAFVTELRKRIGNHPILLYSGQGFWEGGESSGPVTQYGDLVTWDAFYPLHPESGYASSLYERIKNLGWGKRWGNREPKIWQFSANGLVAGMEVDVNAFDGTREELLSLTGNKDVTVTYPRWAFAGAAVGDVAAAKAATVSLRNIKIEDSGWVTDPQQIREVSARSIDAPRPPYPGNPFTVAIGSPTREHLDQSALGCVDNKLGPNVCDVVSAIGNGYSDTLRLLRGHLKYIAGVHSEPPTKIDKMFVNVFKTMYPDLAEKYKSGLEADTTEEKPQEPVWDKQKTLVPLGFRPLAPRAGNYTDMHPTRYEFREDIEDLIKRIYKAFPNVHINTYVQHPGDEDGKWARDTIAFDVWGAGGRGDPIGFAVGQAVFDFVYDDPNPPLIDWVIWRRKIRVRAEGFVPRPFGTESFSYHDDHPHFTFVGGYKLLR